MIDQNGYRPNVGIILCNFDDRVFWARRMGQTGWQFPQGGIQRDESPEGAMFRELWEEVGLKPHHVEVMGRTRDWLYYDLPDSLRRRPRRNPHFRGQKQIWYLLRLLGSESDVCLDVSDNPEFEDWCWLDYWDPVERVVDFKREVYKLALAELEVLISAQKTG